MQSKGYSLCVGEQSLVFLGGSAKCIVCRWVSKVYSLWGGGGGEKCSVSGWVS